MQARQRLGRCRALVSSSLPIPVLRSAQSGTSTVRLLYGCSRIAVCISSGARLIR